jgi:hypothetical protein
MTLAALVLSVLAVEFHDEDVSFLFFNPGFIAVVVYFLFL